MTTSDSDLLLDVRELRADEMPESDSEAALVSGCSRARAW